MMFASGAIPNITPRQTAGAAGPKSLRNVMTGRAMSGRPDPDRLVDAEAEPSRDIALVVGEGDRPERVLVQERLADLDSAKGLLPGEVDARSRVADLDPQPPASIEVADRGGELVGSTGQARVAE